jgi:hypothetical protein
MNERNSHPARKAVMLGLDLVVALFLAAAIVHLTEKSRLPEQLAAGEHAVVWDASAMPSGIYYARMSTDGFNASKRLLLVK